MKKTFCARAPAKIIISGEHSVVYGYPAISFAIDKYARIYSNWSSDSIKNKINFNLLDLKYAKSHTIEKLNLIKEKILLNYSEFLNGNYNIKDVLKKPFELLQFSVTNVLEKLQLQINKSINIKVDSEIPLGSGMGSSAAIIMCSLRSLAHLFRINWEPLKFLKLGIDAENLQHGKSSGIDLYISTFGGCYYFDGKNFNKRNLSFENDFIETRFLNNDLDFYIVNTGNSKSSTGECVQKAKEYFLNQNIGREFEQVTNHIELSIKGKNYSNLIEGIKENQRLLEFIQVVPIKVSSFIEDLENNQFVAKVCGSGSIYGDGAGVVLILPNKHLLEEKNNNSNIENTSNLINERLLKITSKYNYIFQKVKADNKGVIIV